jgi:hypothetical protein
MLCLYALLKKFFFCHSVIEKGAKVMGEDETHRLTQKVVVGNGISLSKMFPRTLFSVSHLS